MSAVQSNPYHPDLADDLADAAFISVPFAGRRDAFGRLYRELNDASPNASRALCFVGRRHIGKTALLLAFDAAFGSQYAGARVFLSEAPPDDETDFILMLAQAATEAMLESGAEVSRLNELEPPGSDGSGARTWLIEAFLPVALSILRGRRLIFLIDDVERLMNAIRAGVLPYDMFAFLRILIESFPQIGFGLTLDAEYEPEIDSLSPLIGLNDSFRLSNLAPDETRWLLQEPARGCYTIPDDVAAAVQKLTGGAPALVQQFGYQLFRRWDITPELNVVTTDDLKTLTPEIYKYAEADFKSDWLGLSPNEKRVLGAVSQLFYSDPLRRLDPVAIESWLADTDHPLDLTAVHAALRGLEYAELLQSGSGGVAMVSGLMQSWLLENAPRMAITGHAGPPPRSARASSATSASDPSAPSGMSRRGIPARTAAMMAVAAAVLGILTAAVMFSSPPSSTANTLSPTVTLGSPR